MSELVPKKRTIKHFLVEYAEALRGELDDFALEAGVFHQAKVFLSQQGDRALIQIRFLPPEALFVSDQSVGEPETANIFPLKDEITFTEDAAEIHRRCESFDDLLRNWSNVKAWLDASDIIAEILTAKR